MSCLGVLFALDEITVSTLRSFQTDAEKLDFVHEDIEGRIMLSEPDHFAELVKSWDALHRSLTDGKLALDNGIFPLNHVVLGGEQLYHSGDYIMSLKNPEQVNVIFQAINQITEADLKGRYFKISPDEYGMELSGDDFEYTWDWFQSSIPFWENASKSNRFVLFTVDQ